VVARTTEGDVRKQLVVEAWRGQATDEASRAISSRPQSLEDHQAEVERRTGDTATRLGISEDLKDALVLAARLHDEGKKAENWQTAFRVPRAARPLAKSGSRRPPDFAILNGYRHEFGSLTYLEQDAQFAAMADDMQELVLHLVAAHHGFARPVIRTGGCTDGPPSALEARARDVALRFARLQQRYGPWGLAWLEAIVRAADQQASSALNETTTSASVESRDG